MRPTIAARRLLLCGSALAACGWQPASAQTLPETGQSTAPAATPTTAATPAVERDQSAPTGNEVLVTGSRIRQDPNNSALPLQIVTTQELRRNGISSAEQLIAFLPSSGSGADNLASNSDVVATNNRGNNGASFANLRGQGPGATLVLLNSRRVAAHGTTGAAVDVNQIPFMAIDRVEVLKDGASAIYGTDAVGGVINFITKQNYAGLGASGFVDVTQRGDSPIYRLSAIAGYGKLAEDGFNIMGTVGYSWNGALRAKQRDFVRTYDHDAGLSPDTRGSPFATIVNLAGTAFPTSAAFPLIPGTTQRATGGINVLRLPGGEGCASIPDQGDYDTQVWASPQNGLTCSFDTGRNVYLQQDLKTLTYLARGTIRLGSNDIALEVTGSDADSAKRFSQVQITPNTTTQNYQYRRIAGVNEGAYDAVYNRLVAAFPSLALPGQPLATRGVGFSYRWRCIECGEREIFTNNKTLRVGLSAEGPLFSGWDYRLGGSYAQSEGKSRLGSGYFYQDALVAALNSGAVNPFLFPGQTQSAAGLAAIQSASAAGVTLYGGRYSVKQADGSVSGSLFDIWGGTVKIAAGVDFRREEYKFTGDTRTTPRTIIAAPFEPDRALNKRKRDIKAAYAEVLVPLLPGLEVSAAGRIDDYTGFGTTTNPKVSIKFRPWQPLMIRGSYNTAFRVPTFNQLFDPAIQTLYTGADFADPRNCPNGAVNPATGCVSLDRTVDIVTGGRTDLGPETATEFSGGVVLQPSRDLSLTVDWWSIKRKGTIQTLPLAYLFQNYSVFTDRFIRDANGVLTDIDDRYTNAGVSHTQGIDVTATARFGVGAGNVIAGIDGTYLLKKDTQANSAALVLDQLGVYSLADDLGLRWKHNAYVGYTSDDWSVTLTQIFRSGYLNQQLAGERGGSYIPPKAVRRVEDYILYNLSASYTALPGFRLTAGIRNLLDTDPPFAISYDTNNGSGSSWEPRVADPRGRSFTILVETQF